MGNFDTKHSPYYAIKDESTPNDDRKSMKHTTENHHFFWITKRANFDSDGKNASLFEYNNFNLKHKASNKQLAFALNQIRVSHFIIRKF